MSTCDATTAPSAGSRPRFPALGQSRTDPQIWIDLAQAMSRRDTSNPASYWTDAFPLAWRD